MSSIQSGQFVIKLFPDFENNFIAADSMDIRKFVCRINCHEKEKQKFGMRLESNEQSCIHSRGNSMKLLVRSNIAIVLIITNSSSKQFDSLL